MLAALPPPPSWFPGHMAAFAKALPSFLTKTHVVLEVRDSRLPLTSINSHLEASLVEWRVGGKQPGIVRERIVVYTKRDLAPSWGEERLKRALNKHFEHRIHFVSSSSPRSIRALHSALVSIAEEHQETTPNLNVLVVGMPNVGKSTLLNSLRSSGTDAETKHPLLTSSLPGLTRALSTRLKLSNSHPIYAIDSPGVMIPFLGHGDEGKERGVKLALIAGIKESLYDEQTLALYLIWRLWREMPSHPAYLPLLPTSSAPGGNIPPRISSAPSTERFDPYLVLEGVARRMGAVQRGGILDLDRAARHLVQWWRTLSNAKLNDASSSKTPSSVRGWGFDFPFDEDVPLSPLRVEESTSDPVQQRMDAEVERFVQSMKGAGKGMGISSNQLKKTEKMEKQAKKLEKYRSRVQNR